MLFPGEYVTRTAWETGGLALLWLAPVAVLIGVVVRWPSVAAVALSLGVVLFLGAGIWYVIDPAGWESWEGPDALRAAFAFILIAPLALLGLRRTGQAGLLLLVLGAVLPVSMLLVGTGWEQIANGPEASVSIVSALAGTLFLLSDAANRFTPHAPAGRSPKVRSHPA